MKKWDNWKNQNWFPYTVASCSAVILYMLLSNIEVLKDALHWVVAMAKPLLYGMILAYLMDPVARFYEHRLFSKVKKVKQRRNLSVLTGVITIVIIIAFLIATIVPTIVQSLSSLFDNLSETLTMLGENSGDLSSVILPGRFSSLLAGVSLSSTLINNLTEFVTNNLSNIASASAVIGNGFANFIIAFVLAIYYMMDKERLKKMGRRFFIWMLKEQKFVTFEALYHRADAILIKYIKGNLIEAFIVGGINAILMLIFRLPYVLLISIAVGITNLAPTFGPIVGALIGSFLLLLIDPWYALTFLIFTAIIQTIDGYILKPKLFGDSFGVSPLLILIMIIMGGRIMGVVGILIAIPVAAIAQYMWDELWTKRKSLDEEKVN